MTLLDSRDAEIVRLRRVEGLTMRAVAGKLQVSVSFVHRVEHRFRRELAIFIGPLDKHTPEFLRDVTIRVLDNAQAVRQAA